MHYEEISIGTIVEVELDKGLCKILTDNGNLTPYPVQICQSYTGSGWGIFTGVEPNTQVVLGKSQGNNYHILAYLPSQDYYEDFVEDMKTGYSDQRFGYKSNPLTELEMQAKGITDDQLNARIMKYYPLLDHGDILLKGYGMGSLLLDRWGNVMIEDRYDNRLHFLGGTDNREGTIRQESRHWEVQNEAGYLTMGMIKRGRLISKSDGSFYQDVAFIDENTAEIGIRQVLKDPPSSPPPEEILTEFTLGIFEKADNSLGLQVEDLPIDQGLHDAEDLQNLDRGLYEIVMKNQLVEVFAGTLTDGKNGKIIVTHEADAEPTEENFLETKYGAKVFFDNPNHTNAFIHEMQPSGSHGATHIQGPNYKGADKEVKALKARGPSYAHDPFVKNKKIIFRLKTKSGTTINITEDGDISMFCQGHQDINIMGNVRQNVDGSVFQTVSNDVDQVVYGRAFQTVKGKDTETGGGGAELAAITQYVEQGSIVQVLKEGNISQSIEQGDIYSSQFDGDNYRYVNGDVYEHITGSYVRHIDGTLNEYIGDVNRKIKISKYEEIGISSNLKVPEFKQEVVNSNIRVGEDYSLSIGQLYEAKIGSGKIQADKTFSVDAPQMIDLNSGTASTQGASGIGDFPLRLGFDDDAQKVWNAHEIWNNRPKEI